MSITSLKGQTALITGAAKRLGRAMAMALAEDGVNVVAHYRRSAREAEDLCRELASSGVGAWTLQANLEEPPECQALMGRACEAAGRIDILINSAAIFPPGGFAEITVEEINRTLQVNAWAPLVLMRAFAREAERGKIVNLLDTRIKGYDRLHSAYHLSKHMLAVLTRIGALEFAPRITVNAVAPGLILPPEGEDDSYLERVAGNLPLRTHGGPKDVTDAVLFLLKSQFITGQVIYVDGGRHIHDR